MVFQDFTSRPNPRHFDETLKTAGVFDRLLSVLIDFFVFSPVVALSVALTLRDFRVMALTHVSSVEVELTWFLLVAGAVLLVMFAEAAFVFFFAATPGQRFMQIEVRSFPSEEPLTFPQCLARSFLWLISIPLVVPLLGAYTDSRRRAFHDRATDTMVCTLKTDFDATPVDVERRFFRSWSHMILLFALLVGAGALMQLHWAMRDGVFRREGAQQEGMLCQDIDPAMSGPERLDYAVAGFLAGAWDRDCLEREADFSLWNGKKDEQAFAVLAKGMSIDDSDSAEPYFGKACELQKNGEACGIARFVTSGKDTRQKYLRQAGLTTLSSRMLLVRESIARNQLSAAAGLIKELRREEVLAGWLDHEEVRTFWKMREGVSGKSRAPASVQNQDLFQDFKKRYELK